MVTGAPEGKRLSVLEQDLGELHLASLQQECNGFCCSVRNRKEPWLQSLCLRCVLTVAPSLWAQGLFGNREHDLETSKQRVTFPAANLLCFRPDPIHCEPPGLSPCPAQKSDFLHRTQEGLSIHLSGDALYGEVLRLFLCL